VTHETITAALYNLQAQINEVMGLMKDAAKQPAKDETAGNIIKYSIRLAQLEGAFITLQQHAPALVEVSNQYPLPPLPPPPDEEDDEEESLVITEGVSKTFDRVAKIHADTAAAAEETEE
tara:strand:- start:43 stop:402 length:360 start_codon:yes stop_codon:yes gene_type:complete